MKFMKFIYFYDPSRAEMRTLPGDPYGISRPGWACTRAIVLGSSLGSGQRGEMCELQTKHTDGAHGRRRRRSECKTRNFFFLSVRDSTIVCQFFQCENQLFTPQSAWSSNPCTICEWNSRQIRNEKLTSLATSRRRTIYALFRTSTRVLTSLHLHYVWNNVHGVELGHLVEAGVSGTRFCTIFLLGFKWNFWQSRLTLATDYRCGWRMWSCLTEPIRRFWFEINLTVKMTDRAI